MKNKKLFSFGLYIEGIKQLNFLGIFAFVVFAFEAILIPVGIVIGRQNEEIISAESVIGWQVHPILVAAFVFIAPVMTLILFNFLNKRNSSDFYHSIPHTRFCLFFSYFASIASWLFAII